MATVTMYAPQGTLSIYAPASGTFYQASSSNTVQANTVDEGFLIAKGFTFAAQAGAAAIPGTLNVIKSLSSCSTLGDSTMAYGVDSGAAQSIGGTTGQSHLYWLNDRLNANFTGSGQSASNINGVDVIAPYAVPGVTMDTVITSQLPACLVDGTAMTWTRMGVNNFSSGQNDTVPVALGKAYSIISQLSNVKSLVIVDAINPVLQSGSTSDRLRARCFQAFNQGVASICAQFPNVIFNDTYSDMIDLTSSVLNPITASSYVNSADGIHQTSRGAYAMALGTYQRCFQNRILLSKYKLPGANLLPAFTGSGGTTTPNSGTITGSPPASWAAIINTGANACTITTNGPFINFANVNGAGGTSSLLIQATGGALTQGQTYQFGFGFQTSLSAGSLTTLGSNIQFTGGTVTPPINPSTGQATWHGMDLLSTFETTPTYPGYDYAGYRMAPPFVAGAGITGWTFNLALKMNTNTTISLDVYNPQFFPIN